MKKNKLIRFLLVLAALTTLMSALSTGALASVAPYPVGSEQWLSQPGTYNVVAGDPAEVAISGVIHFTAPQSGSYTISTHATDPEKDGHSLFVRSSDEYIAPSLATDGNYHKNCSVTVNLTEGNTYYIDVHTSNTQEKVEIPVEIAFNSNLPRDPYETFYPEEGYYRIRTELGTDYCLDIGEGSVGGQTIENARIWRAGNSKNGVFHLERDYERDAYIIREPKSNKILDVFGTGSAEGMTVMLWNDDGADDQRWMFRDIDGNGHYMICTKDYGYLYAKGLGNDYDVCCMPYKDPANSSREIWVLERVNYSGSILSQGNVWIVAAVAVVAAGTVAALVITKKKKPAADKTEE